MAFIEIISGSSYLKQTIGPLEISLGIAKIQDFLSFQFILKLSFSKLFHNTLNYASLNANIEEVMKFYNLSNKTFETDFSFGW